MAKKLKFLITDSYPKESREVFDKFGVTRAGNLYAGLLLQHMPEAEYTLLYTGDPGVDLPSEAAGQPRWLYMLWMMIFYLMKYGSLNL